VQVQQPARQGEGIVVQEGDDRALGVLDTGIARAAQSALIPIFQADHSGKSSGLRMRVEHASGACALRVELLM